MFSFTGTQYWYNMLMLIFILSHNGSRVVPFYSATMWLLAIFQVTGRQRIRTLQKYSSCWSLYLEMLNGRKSYNNTIPNHNIRCRTRMVILKVRIQESIIIWPRDWSNHRSFEHRRRFFSINNLFNEIVHVNRLSHCRLRKRMCFSLNGKCTDRHIANI